MAQTLRAAKEKTKALKKSLAALGLRSSQQARLRGEVAPLKVEGQAKMAELEKLESQRLANAVRREEEKLALKQKIRRTVFARNADALSAERELREHRLQRAAQLQL